MPCNCVKSQRTILETTPVLEDITAAATLFFFFLLKTFRSSTIEIYTTWVPINRSLFWAVMNEDKLFHLRSTDLFDNVSIQTRSTSGRTVSL